MAVNKIAPDTRAVNLINAFLAAITQSDSESRKAAAIPHLHATLLTPDGESIDPITERYDFSKAVASIHFYAVPAVITEVHEGEPRTVGFGDQAEPGRVDKYFLDKRDGVAGEPAPLGVFWPADGGAPSLLHIGKL